MIPESVIDEILTKADIESVVSKYVSLKRKGSNLWGLCPFHSEKTPSFSVHPQKGIFKCFSCSKGGNSIKFIMEIEHLNYPEAIRFLGNQYGVEIPDTRDGYRDDDKRDLIKRVKKLLNDVAGFYYKSFNNPEIGIPAREYADKRGLDKSTLDHFGIGYSPLAWEATFNYLKEKGYTEDEMLASGIFRKSEKNGRLFDLFRGRLMFPIFDSYGTIIAFGGRALGDETPKYINSPDTVVYNKHNHLYALNFAKKEQSDTMIVVEGYMDAIAMHRAGFRNTVAALGTSFTDNQLKLCARFAKEVVFFFDADNAGQNAAIRAIRMMLSYLAKLTGLNINIKIAKVPDGKDPDEFIKVNGAEKFIRVVNDALDVDKYLLMRAYNDNYNPDKGLDTSRYQEDICLYGSWVADEIKRSMMANKAAEVLSANPQAIINRMNGLAENELARQELSEARERARQREEDLKNRNNQIEPKYDMPEPPASDEQYEEPNDEVEVQDYTVDESATENEIMLFAYAISLGAALGDQKLISRTDVLRPDDFKGDTMKVLVRTFLGLFDTSRGVSYARMNDFFTRLRINGMPAEDVMDPAYSRACNSANVTVKRDMYLGYLYRIRIDVLSAKEEELVDRRAYAAGEERDKIDALLNKIIDYKDNMISKIQEF